MMKTKCTVANFILLLLVLTFVQSSAAGPKAVKEDASQALQSVNKEEANGQASGVSEKEPVKSEVVAYYFHGNQRCRTCRTIEAYAEEAIQNGFADVIKDGRLKWKVINIDEQENEHYVQDFQLVTRSLVLQAKAKGTQERWKNLSRVWELVRNKEAFQDYVQEETRAFLEGRDQ
jgi:frataxin-like iron-binding protein CyaY